MAFSMPISALTVVVSLHSPSNHKPFVKLPLHLFTTGLAHPLPKFMVLAEPHQRLRVLQGNLHFSLLESGAVGKSEGYRPLQLISRQNQRAEHLGEKRWRGLHRPDWQ